jgi:hypothetical protein
MIRGDVPWYRRVSRWGQTNLTEPDPGRFDLAFWRDYWRRTRIQGVIVNAGGIVAYYPSRLRQHRALHLGDRDLYGEIVAAAREEGLAVLARMDSNRVHQPFFVEHPDWFARDAAGQPYREGDLYIACVNGPYYGEFLPDVLREIVERSHPDGFTDNSWSGLPRDRVCHCGHCVRLFREETGYALPRAADWSSPVYRQWIAWSYERRLAVWDLNNRVTRGAGGPDCLWVGMNAGDVVAQATRFRDCRAICERAEIVMLDSQSRVASRGFQANAEAGQLVHGLLGWEKLVPESTALYNGGQPTFRLASKPEPEVRLWALEGFAGGISPWWHHIGAYHEDRRQYRVAEPLFAWHEANEAYLFDRRPLATVGVVWSQRSVDFFGQDAPEERVALPWRGIGQALVKARIPYVPVHVDHVERDGPSLTALVLPNLGVLSDAQAAAVRRFVERGGGLLATGESSLYDEWGDRRPDFALADIFGASSTGTHHGSSGPADPSWETWAQHSYLRLSPELRVGVYGPKSGAEPAVVGERHSALVGFEQTDILPFGGRLEVVRSWPGVEVPATYVPPFPIYPPETSWMRQSDTSVPALVLQETPTRGRVAYLAADLDRVYGRDNLPDHARLLANLVRWVARGRIPLAVEGSGLVDCHLYAQTGRLVLHIVNLSNAGAWRAPVDELTRIGPLRVRVELPRGLHPRQVRFLVRRGGSQAAARDGWVTFEVPSVTDHEVVVIE